MINILLAIITTLASIFGFAQNTVTIHHKTKAIEKGKVCVQPCATGAGFFKIFCKPEESSITAASAFAVFANIPRGVYSLSFTHKANNDRKLNLASGLTSLEKII